VPDLVASGERVRALVLDRAEATAALGLAGAQVELFEGDLDRPSTIEDAMEGVTKVFLLVPGSPRLVEQEATVIAAARRAGVDHLVNVSGLGATVDSPFTITRWHAESEERLRSSGLAYTILQPNFFMANLLFLFPTLLTEGVIAGPMGEGRVSVLDHRDLAAVAATVLTEPGHGGMTYVVTGPEALSFGQMADAITTGSGRPVRYVELSPVESRRVMVASGTREPFADALLGLFRFFAEGHASVVTDVVAKMTGRPPRRLEDFVMEEAAAFHP
jgi:uncharacterized protein YbjT (DUF2867 family)